MKKLSRYEFNELLPLWYKAWNDHNLDGVLDMIHDDIVFVNWNGSTIIGKKMLQRSWALWFKNDEIFRFKEEDTFIDEINQKVLFRWSLEWKSCIKKYHGMNELRFGNDILHFKNGKIIKKYSYLRTDIKINGQTVILPA